jgi:predicted PurR-regulated permease PerM
MKSFGSGIEAERSCDLEKLKFKQSLFLVTFGIVLYLLLQNLNSILGVLRLLRNISMPLIYGFVIAYLLNIPYKWYRDRLFARMKKRGGLPSGLTKLLSVIMAYVTVLLIVALLIWIIIPQLFTSITLLIQNIPYYIDSAEEFINKMVEDFELQHFYSGKLTGSWASMLEFYSRKVQAMMPDMLNRVMDLTSILFNLLIGIAFSVYLLYSKEKLIVQGKRFLWAYGPRKYNKRLLELAARGNLIFTRFIAGNLLDAILIGILCFLGMTVFNFPYAMLVSVIIGVTNLIPIIGPFIGAVPGALIILTVDPEKALYFLLFILVLQQIDGNIIKPRLFGNQIGLPSLWVLLAIVVGGGLFGIFGMLIAVPVFALLYTMLREGIEKRLNKRRVTIDPATGVPIEVINVDEIRVSEKESESDNDSNETDRMP